MLELVSVKYQMDLGIQQISLHFSVEIEMVDITMWQAVS
jgi:hypothetical protein